MRERKQRRDIWERVFLFEHTAHSVNCTVTLKNWEFWLIEFPPFLFCWSSHIRTLNSEKEPREFLQRNRLFLKKKPTILMAYLSLRPLSHPSPLQAIWVEPLEEMIKNLYWLEIDSEHHLMWATKMLWVCGQLSWRFHRHHKPQFTLQWDRMRWTGGGFVWCSQSSTLVISLQYAWQPL